MMSRVRWETRGPLFVTYPTLLILFCFWITSCATYQSEVAKSRDLLKTGQISAALEDFKKLAEKEDRDQLVHMMDYATVLQIAGQYKESAAAFLKADQLVDLNDYHSATNVVSATLGGEEMIQYKGESYEKFLINTMNAINYVMLGQYDDALVEARRINEKLSKMKMDGREAYEQSPFARYLAGVLWEAERKYDDAYIEYQGSYQLDSSNPLLPKDLIRTAKLSRRMDDYKKLKSEFSKTQENPNWYDRDQGEVVVIFQQGWGPQKQARQQYRFPELYPVMSNTQTAQVTIDGVKESTELVYNIERVSIKTLEKDFGSLVARRVGGVAAKAVVADQIRQKNELLGSLTWIAMNLADRADLRQWSTLPQRIQMSRIFLKPGKYKISIQGLNYSGTPTQDVLEEQEIVVKAGRKTFINWRSLH
jgi:hypothetical protein